MDGVRFPFSRQHLKSDQRKKTVKNNLTHLGLLQG